MFTLRTYRPADFARLLEIDHACFIEGIAYTEEEMRSFLTVPSAIALVAEQDGKIQAFIVADRYRQRRSSHCLGRIITIDVMPDSQRSGLGTLLINRSEEELAHAGCDYVSLEVAVDNHRALRFYKRHGYSVLKTLPRYYLDSIDGLLMGKKL